MADTIGTDDRTVKYVGVVGLQKLDLGRDHEIEFELDWNEQTNGSYLAAGIYLSPVLTTTTPESEANWVRFEYVGVPPGRNARGSLALRENARLELLHTEGWPDHQRAGRKIARQHIRLHLEQGVLRVFENDELLYDSRKPIVSFSAAYLYLQMSSHSNYPAREVFFDDVIVRASCTQSSD